MRLAYILICSALFISGCTKTVDEMSYSERVALAKGIEESCVKQGTVPGTPEYSACLDIEAQREITGRANTQQRQRAALRNLGNQMQENARNQALVDAMNRPRTTDCYRYFNQVRCNTY